MRDRVRCMKMVLLLGVGFVMGCSNSTGGPGDASTDAPENDAAQEAAADSGPVTCTTPGAACPSGGKCFFAVGDCAATTGICADDSACAGASTETVCACDGTMPQAPQCGPGNYALVKASAYGPCPADAGTD